MKQCFERQFSVGVRVGVGRYKEQVVKKVLRTRMIKMVTFLYFLIRIQNYKTPLSSDLEISMSYKSELNFIFRGISEPNITFYGVLSKVDQILLFCKSTKWGEGSPKLQNYVKRM